MFVLSSTALLGLALLAAPADASERVSLPTCEMGTRHMLMVHPSQAERQVEVSRHERTLASYRQGEQQARAEAQQYREEKARLQAECSGQLGLTGVIANGWMDEKGVVARLLKEVTSRPGDALYAEKVISFRAVGPNGRGRVAVEVMLFNLGTVAWTPTRAALVGSKREELTGLTGWWPG